MRITGKKNAYLDYKSLFVEVEDRGISKIIKILADLMRSNKLNTQVVRSFPPARSVHSLLNQDLVKYGHAFITMKLLALQACTLLICKVAMMTDVI